MCNEDRFASMWRRSREDAGKSQDWIASRLGVSKKTVQHWEQGLSCPSQSMGFRWFQELGLQPLPYYLEMLYPSFEGIEASSSDKSITKALIDLIYDLPMDAKRKLFYVMSGDHGSSPIAILELMTAHLQTPLRARLGVAEIVRSNYEVAVDTGSLRRPEHIQPNIEMLNCAYISGKSAVKDGMNSYTIWSEKHEDNNTK